MNRLLALISLSSFKSKSDIFILLFSTLVFPAYNLIKSLVTDNDDDKEFDEEVEYRIMGSTESDPINGLISNDSPIGKALLGKKEGEEIEVETPGGTVKFKILKITA